MKVEMAMILPRKTLEVLKEKVHQVPERYPGYRCDLWNTLTDILKLQTFRSYGFAQRITREIEALGEKLEKNEGGTSS